MKTKPPPKRLNYFMVAGNVIYREGDDVTAIMMNAMITGDDHKLGLHALAKAQQALQISLFNKLEETKDVIDVVILSIIPLGSMTEAEFNHRPEGVTIQQKPPIDSEDPFASEIADRVLAS